MLPSPAVRRTALVLFLFAVGVGCSGGGSGYYFSEGDIARRYLPSVRTVDAHPDSLHNVQIEEREDGGPKLVLDGSYRSMTLNWSATYQSVSATGRNRQRLTYATLWSRELSLASLEAEMGVSSLTGDPGWRMIEQREEEYRSVLQIDVYWFDRGNRVVSGPSAFVRLSDLKGNRYKPTRTEFGPLRETTVQAGETALYRRNTFYFVRTVDGTDILDGVEGLRLDIRPSGGSEVRFSWKWKSPEA